MRTAALLAVLSLPGLPAAASSFTQNEIRAAALRDEMRAMQVALKPGTENRRIFGERVSKAFEGEADRAQAAEDYDRVAAELIGRAAALERRVESLMSRNSPEAAEQVRTASEVLFAMGRTLRSDYELYTRLPTALGARERAAARATMRFLAQTGSFPQALAFYNSRLPEREPFKPLPAGFLPDKPK